MDSILVSTKKYLGIDEAYNNFDETIIMAINTAFSSLSQLINQESTSYKIVDSSNTWDEYTDDTTLLGFVKTYIFLKTRILFDPPASSFALEALERTTKELEWRISIL